jgi:membrane fusion protein, multidrug efflux system
LAANVAGRVLKTEVERGQSIKAGTLLAQVDIQAARLALAEAKVSVQTSETQEKINRSECERYERLKSAGVVTDLEYDQVTAKCKTAPLNLEAARARESIAAKNVGDGLIRAPFSGVVTERYVEVGEYVQASTRVVSLAQVDSLRVVFSVPERHFPDIKMGAEVQVSVAAYDSRSFAGTVAHISGAVRDTRDIVVEATVPNAESLLLPGMFAEVRLTIGTQKLPSIPPAATFDQNGKSNVFVVKDGRLLQRVVVLGERVGDRLVVQRGLSVGDEVVATYDSELRNGVKVK